MAAVRSANHTVWGKIQTPVGFCSPPLAHTEIISRLAQNSQLSPTFDLPDVSTTYHRKPLPISHIRQNASRNCRYQEGALVYRR